MNILEINNIKKTFGKKDAAVQALRWTRQATKMDAYHGIGNGKIIQKTWKAN